MKTRILTALILLPILIAVLLSNVFVITGALLVVSIIGLWEFYGVTGIRKSRILALLGYIGGGLIILARFIPQELYFMLFYACFVFLFVLILAKHKELSVDDAGVLLLSLAYIPFLLSTLIGIRELPYGKILLWIVFVGAFMTDTCAYFTGVFLGRHKLCPNISPKKTIEGAIGGSIGCIIALLLFALFVEKRYALPVGYIKWAVLGLMCAIVSQIGDLTASIIKRKYGVKDYGKLFPGHGGILDRLDSVITVAPLVYIYLSVVGI